MSLNYSASSLFHCILDLIGTFCPPLTNKLVTSKAKAIVLITPINTSGTVYSPELIAQFAEPAREKNIALVIDKTYHDFVEHFPPHHLFSPLREMLPTSWQSNLVHLFSFSKSYAIPGLRLGPVVASPELLKVHYDDARLHPDLRSSIPPQLALADASVLLGLRSPIQSNAKALKARHEPFRKLLPPEWTIGSQGGFYAFVRHPFQNVSSISAWQRN